MSKKEKDLLMVLDNNENISQRKIAKKTGLSLGTVNTLIKKCVKKGLLKIEKLNSRNLRYILTPAGIKEKMKKTISYVKRSYKAIITLKNQVKELSKEKVDGGNEIIVMGEKDEIYELVVTSLEEMDYNYSSIKKIEDMETKKKTCIFYWDPEMDVEGKDDNEKIEFVNIMSFIE